MSTVNYMQRTRDFYAAQGYERAYVWAHYDEAPFASLSKPLAQCTVGLVTTAALYDRKPLEPRHVDSAATEPGPERLYANDLAWAKESTHMDDPGSYLPLPVLKRLVEEERIGAVASRMHCVPTEYSQRNTLENDAPEILRRLREDGADIALLVPL